MRRLRYSFRRILPLLACALPFLLAPAPAHASTPALPAPTPAHLTLPEGLYAEFTTPRGPILAELFFTRAPLTVTNFVGLAEGTLGPTPRRPFYDGLTFHRVVSNFVIQGGDPLGTGEGGPGYEFPDEFVPGLRHDTAGILSMANAGPDTNGSQFFLTLAPVNRLNYLHSVFGRVIHGLDVLPQIQPGDPIATVTIRRIGPAAESFRANPDTFAALIAQTPRATPPLFDDPDAVLPPNPPRAKTFATKLANLQRATGLKLHVRLFATFSPETPAQRPGNFTVSLARKLHLTPTDILAVHFADTAQWGLWLGDDHVPTFMNRPGTLAEFTRTGALHEAKQNFLATAQSDATTLISAAENAAAPRPLTAAQKTKLHVDALIDTLIFKLEPSPRSSPR